MAHLAFAHGIPVGRRLGRIVWVGKPGRSVGQDVAELAQREADKLKIEVEGLQLA
jgi:hypothetical protein